MLNNIGTTTLETERLILRKFHITDAQDMFDNWAKNPTVCKFLTWEHHDCVETTQKVLTSWINAYETETQYNWAIVSKATSKVIGSISVVDMSQKHRNCEIGYCIGENYWNKGIATEALKTVINYMFDVVGMHRIQAKHDAKNPASGKVMEKSGMNFEGTMKHARLHKDNSWGDTNIWAIIKL